MAQRIQRRRVKGWTMPDDAVNVCRPRGWGNPYRVGDTALISAPSVSHRGVLYGYGPIVTPAIAVLLFRIWVADRFEDQIREELAGKDLVCWCPLDQPCHADVLLEIANGPDDA